MAAAGTIVDEPTFPFVSVSLRTPRILLDMRSGDVANVLTMVNTSAFLLAIIGHWSNVVDWFADGYLQDGETDRAECILEHETWRAPHERSCSKTKSLNISGSRWVLFFDQHPS